MIINIKSYDELDTRKLMDLYIEGNAENAADLYPDESEETAVKKVEESFLDFLKTRFFAAEGSEYFILEENGEWISALRTSLIRDGFYYLEALETRPDMRKKGYAKSLLLEVIDIFKGRGAFELHDRVHKTNEPSIRTHLSCGFSITSENGFSYLDNTENERCFGMGYAYCPDGENCHRVKNG